MTDLVVLQHVANKQHHHNDETPQRYHNSYDEGNVLKCTVGIAPSLDSLTVRKHAADES
jgi:hypothetical protein